MVGRKRHSGFLRPGARRTAGGKQHMVFLLRRPSAVFAAFFGVSGFAFFRLIHGFERSDFINRFLRQKEIRLLPSFGIFSVGGNFVGLQRHLVKRGLAVRRRPLPLFQKIRLEKRVKADFTFLLRSLWRLKEQNQFRTFPKPPTYLGCRYGKRV